MFETFTIGRLLEATVPPVVPPAATVAAVVVAALLGKAFSNQMLAAPFIMIFISPTSAEAELLRPRAE